jgi:hypothetical protein
LQPGNPARKAVRAKPGNICHLSATLCQSPSEELEFLGFPVPPFFK